MKTYFVSMSLLLLTFVPRQNECTVRKFSATQFHQVNFNTSDSDKQLVNVLNNDEGEYTQNSPPPSPSVENHLSKIAVLYDSSGVDSEFQLELLKSVFISLRDLDEDDLDPHFMDLANIKPVDEKSPLVTSANWIYNNGTTSMVSLLSNNVLGEFSKVYDDIILTAMKETRIAKRKPLKIITPRIVQRNMYPKSVNVLSLQMSQRAISIVLLNRVEKVGIRSLIPVLDDASQMQFLNNFLEAGYHRPNPIFFTQPVFMDNPDNIKIFRDILNQSTTFNVDKIHMHNSNNINNEINYNFMSTSHNATQPSMGTSNVGILLLALQGSRLAMKIVAQRNHVQMGWFSPDILQHEEWAYDSHMNVTKSENATSRQHPTEQSNTQSQPINRDSRTDTNQNDSFNETEKQPHFFGLYTIQFVGARGWDNPGRRRALREITSHTGASPRILAGVLAYDAAWIARNYVKSELQLPMTGLSGEIGFDSNGFRREGLYFGVSAVPDLSSPSVALLQPSTWILEDVITMVRTIEGQHLITDYDVAKSSLITKKDLLYLAKKSTENVGCSEHTLDILTHDPFNQMSYTYMFKESNLPENLLLPNHHGFGINFLCTQSKQNASSEKNDTKQEKTEAIDEDYSYTSTLQIACTPGGKFSDPIRCFRSKFRLRQKRSSGFQTQYSSYNTYGNNNNNNNQRINRRQDTYSDSWNPQNNRWTIPRDDSQSTNFYQAPPPSDYQVYQAPATEAPASGYNSYLTTRLDTGNEPSSTPASAAAPAAPSAATKLPELRQILKAAKPFVGSCIGSSTGCAMCVLVLGRLPLGAVPAACTGPCFVGTFGGCGALLGRVFSETTVICTELFKQGLIGIDTFIADADFGRSMLVNSPETLKGYQLLATPLVEMMQKSEIITNIVAVFALPWAHHMKYLIGRSDQFNLMGYIIHSLGSPLCRLVGVFYNLYHSNIPNSFSFLSMLLSFTISLLFSIHSYFIWRKKSMLQTRVFSVLTKSLPSHR